ncbi:MAG: 23S rRNA (pseudouridine(1915)-N(3))-methyltransferase RlmH [Verrucomicrobiae bacterium]
MIWKILAIGEPSLAHAREGVRDYLARLKGFGKIEARFLKPGPSADRRALEESAGHFRIVMDERGKQFSSREFAAEIQRLENRSIARCALLVGGADGWGDGVRSQADLVWALGLLTLQHELALVVALEQIYRAATIKARMPYHRD